MSLCRGRSDQRSLEFHTTFCCTLAASTGLNVEDTTVRVAEHGTIFVPFVIDLNLKVQGLSPADLKRLIQY